MDWTRDMGFALVNVYKNKEVLWNPQHCEYHQKNKRNDSWQEVADELSAIIKKPVPALECKRKMDTFLSSFRRERVKKRKISETTEGGTSGMDITSARGSDAYHMHWKPGRLGLRPEFITI
ncbi:hypothetical protein ANTPLA_LOCUS10770 [Anthophora plagiata]